MKRRLSIFLSHSSNDIEKVRKIRDILEFLEFQPLMFHLCCLDDDNDTLEDFIKREIDARNVFVYCKSSYAESSPWVRKELEYIKTKENARFYELDIELPFYETIPSVLSFLSDLIRSNTVFLSCARMDTELYIQIANFLENNDYHVIRYDEIRRQGEGMAFIDRKNSLVEETVKNGFFLPIVTSNYIQSLASSEFAMASESENLDRVIPLYINFKKDHAMRYLDRHAELPRYVELETSPDLLSENELKRILSILSSSEKQ